MVEIIKRMLKFQISKRLDAKKIIDMRLLEEPLLL